MDPKLKMTTGDEALQQESRKSAEAAGTVQRGGSVAFLASGLGPQICFAPEGLAADAGAGAGGNDGGQGSGDAGKGSGSDGGKADDGKGKKSNNNRDGGNGDAGKGGGGSSKPERPDWLPESIWDAEKGFKKEDFDALVASKAERDAAKAQVPEKADGYQAKLPATFKLPEGFELPQGETVLDENDPRIASLREVAHQKGWSQSDFEDVIAYGIHQDIAEQQRMKEAVSAEREKLGSRAKERIQAVTTWLDAKLGADVARSLHSMMFTAKQAEAFEALMRLNRGDVPGTPGAGRDVKPVEVSDEDWSKMSTTDKILYSRKNSKSN